ncbi:MAG: hypothetical protein GXO93_06265 [FCB group bacterium]|nr:hypothetical protein [FCB group bacterium]
MKVAPQYLSFVGAVNGSNPLPQSLYVGSSSGETFSYNRSKSASWLDLLGGTGMAPESLSVNIDITGLSQGMYLDTILFTSDEILNSPQMVVCSLSLSPWFLQQSGMPHKLEDVYFTDETHGWAVGFVGNLDTLKSGFILSTSDGGAQWHLDTLLNNSNTLLGAINFIDNYGWIVGQSGIILHSSDGGATWAKISSDLIDTSLTLNDVYFISPAKGWIIGDSGVILNTNDSGKTWSLQTSPTSRYLRSVIFVNTNNGWIVGDYDVILHTSDGGDHWSYQPNGQYDLRGVYFSDVNNGWAVGKSGTVIHTADGGSSWIKQTTNITENLSALYFVNDSLGWVVGNKGTVLYTNDGGNSWTKQFTDTNEWLFSVYFVDSLTGWVVGNNGLILKTQSGGN